MKKYGLFALMASLGLFAAGCGHHDFSAERAAHDQADHGGHPTVVVEPAHVVVPTIEVRDTHPMALPIARREPVDPRTLGTEAREDVADAASLAAKEAAEQLLHQR
jgi:hypothetical protein